MFPQYQMPQYQMPQYQMPIRVLGVFLTLLLVFGSSRLLGQEIVWPGERIATIETLHLKVYVPRAQVQRLGPLVERAELIFEQMIQDANYKPQAKLSVLLGDFVDFHNGFSFVVPFPLVQVELASPLPDSPLFAGAHISERTLIHEFAHHISNDQNHGFRAGLERVFGRILPNDLVSAILFYLSTPAHQLSPRFWHEGLATWAETVYADPNSVWQGRGRDALIHMVWRLDAEQEKIPEVGDWRITYQEWPFGNRAYIYGVAYVRYLQAAYQGQANLWQIIEKQALNWPYFFDGNAHGLLKNSHQSELERTRRALQIEQSEQISKLQAVPFTEITRMTPLHMRVAAPAWRADGSLVFAGQEVTGRARLYCLTEGGELTKSSTRMLGLRNIRSFAGDELCYTTLGDLKSYSRIQVGSWQSEQRFFQPDAKRQGGELWIASIQNVGAGQQNLVVNRLRADGELVTQVRLKSDVLRWSPTFRPGSEHELLWVETDASGSKLVLGHAVTGRELRTLIELPGKIIHPCWTADGRSVIYCTDISGVVNAYELDLEEGAQAQALTHTIGGVIACVPSPDNSKFAIIDHDINGPFVSILHRKSAMLPTGDSLPSIDLAWPAPFSVNVASSSQEESSDYYEIAPIDLSIRTSVETTTGDYNGFTEMRPHFWSPTSFAAPGGGLGVFGFASDPLFTHLALAGMGAGNVEQEAVGFLSYSYRGWPIELNLTGYRSEMTTFDQVVDIFGRDFDYTETITALEFNFGRGILGIEQRWFAFAGLGVAEHRGVDASTDDFSGLLRLSTPIFDGREQYFQLVAGYGNATFYPAGYAPVDGFRLNLNFRHSGFAGDLERNRIFFDGAVAVDTFKDWGQQLVVGSQLGWSDGEENLQSNFSIGGSLAKGLPRGYFSTEVVGQHLVAASVAYRAPLWRKFKGLATTPFRHRQLVLEVFADSGKVSRSRPGGGGEWFSSIGLELHSGWEFSDIIVQPGIGVAIQLDGDEDSVSYFNLGFRF